MCRVTTQCSLHWPFHRLLPGCAAFGRHSVLTCQVSVKLKRAWAADRIGHGWIRVDASQEILVSSASTREKALSRPTCRWSSRTASSSIIEPHPTSRSSRHGGRGEISIMPAEEKIIPEQKLNPLLYARQRNIRGKVDQNIAIFVPWDDNDICQA
jgi:hypothetical protein